jgi:hypothetical protein
LPSTSSRCCSFIMLVLVQTVCFLSTLSSVDFLNAWSLLRLKVMHRNHQLMRVASVPFAILCVRPRVMRVV